MSDDPFAKACQEIEFLREKVRQLEVELRNANADLEAAMNPKKTRVKVSMLRDSALSSHLTSGRYEYSDYVKQVLDAAADLEEQERQIQRLTTERDEARQEVCYLKSADRCGVITAKHYALLRKWDCFRENA